MVQLRMRHAVEVKSASPLSVEVPQSIDHELEVSDRCVSALEGARNRIWNRVLALYETGMFPGISLCIRHHNQIILNRSVGYAVVPTAAESGDIEGGLSFFSRDKSRGVCASQWLSGRGTRWTPRTPVCLFSGSKMITATIVHALVEQKLVKLDVPIARFLPEVAPCPIGKVTLRDILTHRAGVPSFSVGVPLETIFDPQQSLFALMRQTPGSSTHTAASAYHAVTGGVLLGAVIERVTEHPLPLLLNELLRRPLNMKYFTFGLEGDKTIAAKEYMTGSKPNPVERHWTHRLLGTSLQGAVRLTEDPRFRSAVMPAANVFTTAEEVCRFLEMMMTYGWFAGRQVLLPSTVSSSVSPDGGWRFDTQLMLPMRYSAGFMLGANPIGLWGPASKTAFGHLGFTNKWIWANPKTHTAVCLLTNGNTLMGPHLKPLIQFILEVSKLKGF